MAVTGEHVARRRGRVNASRSRRGDDAGDCEPQIRFRGDPAAIAATLRGADAGVRENVMHQLQRQVGNEAALQVATDVAGPAVQRWAVNIARGTTDCMVVVNWMNAHSPYRDTTGWAKTSATHDWSGPLVFGGDEDSLRVSVRDPTVTLAKSVDMPQWSPTHPAMRTAWTAMTSDLRAHEARHEAIGERWKATMAERLKNLSLPVSSRRDGQRLVQAEFDSWVAEHQAEQTSIDPFTAMLDCSAAAETAESAGDSGSGPEAASGADDGADSG